MNTRYDGKMKRGKWNSLSWRCERGKMPMIMHMFHFISILTSALVVQTTIQCSFRRCGVVGRSTYINHNNMCSGNGVFFFSFLLVATTHFELASTTSPPFDATTNPHHSDSENGVQLDDTPKPNDSVCDLWMAESSFYQDQLGLFTGLDLAKGEQVLEGSSRDVLIPIYDANQNEWSPWHDAVVSGHAQVDLFLQNNFQVQAFSPGLPSMIVCSDELSTVASALQNSSIWYDSLGVHRSKNPSAGSFSYRQSRPYVASTDLVAGRELFAQCDDSTSSTKQQETNLEYIGLSKYIKQQTQKPISMLRDEGICVSNLSVRLSTIPNSGRGAFVKRRVPAGGTILSSPVIALDRSQMEIVRQRAATTEDEEGGRVKYSELVHHHNLLINYCYGHPNSTILLLPTGPGVNYINHNHQRPNAILDWSRSNLMNEELLAMNAHALLEASTGDGNNARLIINYVALRDIQPGEEIFLDYGPAWETAWEIFRQRWEAPVGSETYVSAVDYRATHEDEAVRTVDEQKENPYPDNIITTCFFKEEMEDDQEEDDDDDDEDDEDEDEDEDEERETPGLVWGKNKHMGCLRPCTIHERYTRGSHTFFNVEAKEIANHLAAADECGLSQDSLWVTKVPASAVQLADKEYTSDQLMSSSFRHEIGVRPKMYPYYWMMEDPEPTGDFVQETLAPGQIEQIKWKEEGTVVAENAHVIGLPPRVREVLLEYCDQMGITERFRDHTVRGNALPPGEDKAIILNKLKWLVQRPKSHWKSNMHWISPRDVNAQGSYLRALSAAGFDEVLQQVGETLGMEGLAAYHLSFIGVSHCNRGYLHHDVTNTGKKAFNMIIPLILANETGPELDIREDGSANLNDVGRLRYKYNVASMVGDDAYHATSAVDYRVSKEMRMAASVYIADIHEENVDAILKDYTQSYPPPGRPDILLEMAGTHWKKDDPSVALPKPTGAENWFAREA